MEYKEVRKKEGTTPEHTMQFVSRMRGKRDIRALTVEEFTDLVKEKKCTPGFTHQEYLTGDTRVHPFYDWDAKLETVPTGEEFQHLKDKHLADFRAVVEKIHPGRTIIFAQRHGILDAKAKSRDVFKISYRAYVQGESIVYTDIPVLARERLGLAKKETHPFLDLGVYKDKSQLLGVIYACKDIDKKKRYLLPLDDGHDASDFLVQNVEKDDTMIEVGGNGVARGNRGRPKKVIPKVGGEVEGAKAKFLAACAIFFGERCKLGGPLEDIVADHQNQTLTLTTKGLHCDIKGEEHNSNHSYVVLSQRGGGKLKCHDDDCKAKGSKALATFDEFPGEIQEYFKATFGIHTAPEVERDAYVEQALSVFTESCTKDNKGPGKLVLTDQRTFTNSRLVIACAPEQFCAIHEKVHDNAACWLEMCDSGSVEMRCGMAPHKSYPNPPCVSPIVQNVFNQVNIGSISLVATKDNTGYQRMRNVIVANCEEMKLRKDRDGMIYKRVRPELSYAFAPWQTCKEFAQSVLKDNEDAMNEYNSIDKVTKFLTDQRFSACDFIDIDRHHLGFSNGVLNIVTCEFTPASEVSPDLVVRKYFDTVIDVDDTETVAFDKLVRYQLREDDMYETLCALIGRLFFRIKERDDWQVMLYILSEEAGTGKSKLIETIESMFTHVGAIAANFEPVFGLSGLVDKEVVITDDLPADIRQVLDQQIFQTMVSGGSVPVPTKRETAGTKPWAVPQVFGGNWHLNYIDKGQIARRVVEITFERPVDVVDTTLMSQIQRELPQIMLKCLRAYKKTLEEHPTESFWAFCPKALRDNKDELRESCNPLFNFLRNSPRVLYEEGATTFLADVKVAFSEHIKKPVKKLDHPTFRQVNPDFIVCSNTFACKSCNSLAGAGCCKKYNNNNRRKVPIVRNLRLVPQATTETEVATHPKGPKGSI